MSDDRTNITEKKKSHRQKKSSKRPKNKQSEELTDKERNPKAFSFHSVVKAERRFRHKQDYETKKQHVPLIDRTPLQPPPVVVAVVGPQKVGKSTLINGLIKLFTKSPLTDVKGPVTIVVGKKRRLTLVECNNDMNSMIDLAKVADLVLLLCDASFGFEMEIFEFLNICQVHGMPRIMGVLTHLDMIKNNKTLKNVKKTLKHRFWMEVYPGAKLFYLSGLLHGEYLNNEIKNLGRFISVIKLRPLAWRITHSYLLGDRYEDLTSQELIRRNPKCDRKIALYGYVRGIPLSKNILVHVAGLGDLRINSVWYLPDPCPLPETIKKRALVEKEKLIYAPFSGVGGIVYDKDAVYVELGGSHSHNRRNNTESDNIVANLIETRESLDTKMAYSELQIFTGGTKLTAKDVEIIETNETSENTGNDGKSDDEEDENYGSDEQVQDEEDSDFEESNDEDDTDFRVKWKENLLEWAQEAFLDRQSKVRNLMKLVYGVFEKQETKIEEELARRLENDDEIGGLFRKIEKSPKKGGGGGEEDVNIFESSLFESWNVPSKNWSEPSNKTLIADCFVTGKWKDSEDADKLLKLDEIEDNFSDHSQIFGDFEDLETGEKHVSEDTGGKRKMSMEKDSPNDKDQLLAEKKRKLKEKFDAEYDNTDKNYYENLKAEAEKQSQLNKSMFENMPDDLRVKIEGYRPGMYVRIELQDVPAEFVNNFDPTYPLLVGALNIGEENVGFVNVKIKKHRWYKRTLKTNDPLIISLGWRRFQTLPIFSKLEDDLKFRYLKYTPQHVTCNGHFWGPTTPQGTGFLALQTCDESSTFAKNGFRIAATGAVQELDKSTQIMKKLKLIGYPYKIYKKTAFVKGMFNSALEVAKFEGARIKTVSGIRGQIKKASIKPEGSFRATFEDKIQLSDIVFCRTWFKVNLKQFYNPVTSLLLPPENRNNWKGARTAGQIKREQQLKNMPNFDSLYMEIEREPKVFKPLVVPRKLQASLSYRDKPKQETFENKSRPEERVAVIKEPYEQKVSNMMRVLRASFEHKQNQLKEATKERMNKHKSLIEGQEAKKMKKLQQRKKVVMKMKSKSKKNTD